MTSTDRDWTTELRHAVAAGDLARVLSLLREHFDDHELATRLEAVPGPQLRSLLRFIGDDESARLLSRLDAAGAAALLDRLAVSDAADILEVMAPDDAADVIAEIPPSEAAEILIEMEPAEADELRELMEYPPDTAGGRMTPAFVAVDPELRVDETIRALRQVAQTAETINYVYVIDDDGVLLGVLLLRDLVLNPPATRIRDLMVTDVVQVPAMADQEEVAHLLNDLDLLALPVVDDAGRLLGIITADDVADILEEETTEDIERLGGSLPLTVSYLRASPFLLWRRRVVWLLVLFAGAAYTTTVLRLFEEQIEELVVLSFYIPLLIGTGGNVGSQVVTTLVRAMSVEGIGLRDVGRVLLKEMQVGLMLGAVMAAVMFVRAWIGGTGYDIAFVVALAVAVIVVWATLVGAFLPLLLRRLGLDPAVVSAPLITTIVDGTGLLIYFLLARLILDL
ncbi:MAG TPA: magnesium transporter [Thermomicrobiales bacterium]|nr:magnesium transporter [Thermomicrobiales bacterium]